MLPIAELSLVSFFSQTATISTKRRSPCTIPEPSLPIATCFPISSGFEPPNLAPPTTPLVPNAQRHGNRWMHFRLNSLAWAQPCLLQTQAHLTNEVLSPVLDRRLGTDILRKVQERRLAASLTGDRTKSVAVEYVGRGLAISRDVGLQLFRLSAQRRPISSYYLLSLRRLHTAPELIESADYVSRRRRTSSAYAAYRAREAEWRHWHSSGTSRKTTAIRS